MTNPKPISTFVINLNDRTDRKEHISKQFSGRQEFNIQIVEACKHRIGAIGLWSTIKHIIRDLINSDDEYILLCEDDHEFTKSYSKDLLFKCIEDAAKMNADILSGGISWFNCSIKTGRHVFWTQAFTGTQFVIVFRKFFNAIYNTGFSGTDSADAKICELSKHVFFIYPFISIQKEFGYSDATPKNNELGRVKILFKNAASLLRNQQKISKFYMPCKKIPMLENLDSITIPTYIINLPERLERRLHILEQFENRSEFDIQVVDACKHEIGAVGLWLSIRKIIQLAISNEDDVIIICEDDHEFTNEYSKELLIKNIFEAHQQAADYMSGGTGKFGWVLQITKNRYWVSFCRSTQFIILFSKFFKQVLEAQFDDSVIADEYLSELTSNKMLIFPFISRQKNFGYSDVTQLHNDLPGVVNKMFDESSQCLKIIQDAYEKYTR